MRVPEPLAATAAASLLKALSATVRARLTGFAEDVPAALPPRCIFCFWHNRIAAIAILFRKFYPRGRGGVTVLTSPSRDGELLARVMGALGMGAVRGSSSRRGAVALRELRRVLEAGGDVAITPDGPRGPRYVLGPGVIHLAQATGVPIIPLHARFSRAWRLRTWDRFAVPLPFSHVHFSAGEPMEIPFALSDLEFEQWRSKLEMCLRHEAD